MDIVGAIKFSIAPRSPDFNTIENIFNYVKSELRTQAFEKKKKLWNIRAIFHNSQTHSWKYEYIDKTIESMARRMLMVIKSKGRGIKSWNWN